MPGGQNLALWAVKRNLTRTRALKLCPEAKLSVGIPSSTNGSSQQLIVRFLLAEGKQKVSRNNYNVDHTTGS